MRWPHGAGLLVAAACCVAPSSARAYEFEVKAQTVGQGYTLQALGLGVNTSVLHRRRISQSLQLNLWDLAGTRDAFKRWTPQRTRGPRIYFSSYLRLDQEQGNFVADQLVLDGNLRDVIDVIPELERSSLQIDLLYGYAAAEGLLGGALDLYAGRQMEVQTLDWFSMDGLKVRAHLPVPVAVEAFGGLRVRESSWAAPDAQAPDGTSSALCEEFVEGATAGSGSWRPIDGLPERTNNAFTSDDEFCPQHEQRMPTMGAALATDGLRSVFARLSYRRSQSASPGLLGEPDRLDFEDRGYYPFELDPGHGDLESGVNEERLALSVRGLWRPGAGVQATPYVAARYSLLHGLIDEAHVGAKIDRGAHGLETELFYSAPTFDGDSIFNVFSSEPYSDARMTWRYEPREQSWSGYVRGWGRRYHSEDAEQAEADLSANAYAGGGQGGLRYRHRKASVRLESFAEDGYGGRRIGGLVAGHWQVDSDLSLESRVSLIRFADDSRSSLRGTNAGVQLGARYQVNRGFTTSLLIEQNSNAFDRFALAAFAMIDLAFQPKT